MAAFLSSGKCRGSIAPVVQVTQQCNLACVYCYARPTTPLGTMPEEVLEAVIARTIEYAEPPLRFCWHGGEPLLAGRQFFDRVLLLQERHNPRRLPIENRVQCNGTLLHPEMLDFLRRHRFRIGVSFDGPEEIMEQTRPGAFRGLPDPRETRRDMTATVVLTKLARGRERVLFDALRERFVAARLNPMCRSGGHACGREVLELSNKDAFEIWRKIYRLWMSEDDPGSFPVEPMLSIVRSLFTGRNPYCHYVGRCGQQHLGIAPDGEVYPCARLAGRKDYLLGNILNCDLGSLREQGRGLMKRGGCDCPFAAICGNGCAAMNLASTGSPQGRHPYCEARKRFFEFVIADLRRRMELEPRKIDRLLKGAIRRDASLLSNQPPGARAANAGGTSLQTP